jgi:polyhydroxyalkanoate synthesis regulator phasin
MFAYVFDVFLTCFYIFSAYVYKKGRIIMADLLEKILLTGLGTVSLTKEKAEKIVNELIARGEIEKARKKETVNDLIKKGNDIKKTLKDMMEREVKGMIEKMPLVAKSEFDKLEKKVVLLEKELLKKKKGK